MHKKKMLLSLFLSAMSAVCALFGPMLIQQALYKLSEGRTTLVVAHRLSTVKNADEIIVLTKDGIEERGTHEQLMSANGLYRQLYEYQFKNL